ncbi:unnamed protein product [Phytomonas sp. Hart1]|nr:unnamed protein product [Phytomonas sp. Hart1]|eukprot:CCW72095.1 unnamed protein product [Phytomonas sp. isolate Hart1]
MVDAEPADSAEALRQRRPNSPILTSPRPLLPVSGPTPEAIAANYGDYVDVCRGRLEACRRFCFLLNWIGQEKYIGDIEPQLEPRKGILQEAEILPPPPEPRTEQERFALVGRQHTDRNQRLSRLTLIWGRDYLRFVDQCYFDDGSIVTIHRRMLTLPELWTRLRRFPISLCKSQTSGLLGANPASQVEKVSPGLKATTIGLLHADYHHLYSSTPTQLQQVERVRNALRDFYGVSTGRVSAVNRAWPLLDYSFIVLRNVEQLLYVEPVSGRPHVCRPLRPTGDPDLAQGVFLNADNDPTHPMVPSRTLIKAKNKRGDEEAYEFDFHDNRLNGFIGHAANLSNGPLKSSSIARLSVANESYASLNANSSGMGRKSLSQSHGASKQQKYDANSVRISSCQLGEGVDQFLIPVLRVLVANALLMIHSLDLSCNHISDLPDFSPLPLQRLYLHGNHIADWAQVETRVCPLPLLTSLTLHGNPIADHDPGYWRELLGRLLNHPNRAVRLRQLDFVTLSVQDYNLAGLHMHVD